MYGYVNADVFAQAYTKKETWQTNYLKAHVTVKYEALFNVNQVKDYTNKSSEFKPSYTL